MNRPDEANRSHEALTRLVRQALTTDETSVPLHVKRKAGRVISDSLACMIAAQAVPEVRRTHALHAISPSGAEATVFRSGRPRMDRPAAAFCNALAGVWAELEEGYRPTACHAGLYVLPALLAEAEFRRLRTDTVLSLTAIAYEIVTRVALAWEYPTLSDQGRGWVHARYSAVGAAAATALARGSDLDTTLAAINGASTLVTVGPRRHAVDGALIWNAWPAVGVRNGMLAVDLAEAGIGGIPGALHDVYGVELGGISHSHRLDVGFGAEWAILDGYVKLHACIQHAHSAVDAAIALGRRLSPSEREKIRVLMIETHPLGLFLQVRHPSTTLAAQFSLPHIVAASILLGHAELAAFSPAAIADSGISTLREASQVIAFTDPCLPLHDRPSRVHVVLEDGRRITETCLSAAGSPDNPLSEDQFTGKLSGLTHRDFPRFMDAVEELGAGGHLCRSWPDVVSRIFAESDF